jgi:threonine dehydrogenase-like Zn-dependent dehydrogenase
VLLNTVSFLELINTSACIDELLSAREERVAFGTDINFNDIRILRRARFKLRAAGADDRRRVILGMNILFHGSPLPFMNNFPYYILFFGVRQLIFLFICKKLFFRPIFRIKRKKTKFSRKRLPIKGKCGIIYTMNIWKTTAPRSLVREECEETETEGKLRVRVTKVLVCDMDVKLFSGDAKLAYPRVPGRFAVGMIAGESENPLFPKGRRVVLHTFLPAPDPGTGKADFSRCDYDVRGITCDGFLRDVIYLSPDEMTPLPDSVNDEQALLLHHAALAKASAERLNAQKGQHVAVVGANLLGIFICQLLIYQQAAPILIDSDASRLDFAHGCGIYYTALANETLLDNVASLTGGRMASGAVYSLDSGNDVSAAFGVCARRTNVVMSGLAPNSVKIDVDAVLQKQIILQAVCDCSDYLETAINLTAQKAFSSEYFRAEIFRAVNAETALSQQGHDVSVYRYINLV